MGEQHLSRSEEIVNDIKSKLAADDERCFYSIDVKTLPHSDNTFKKEKSLLDEVISAAGQLDLTCQPIQSTEESLDVLLLKKYPTIQEVRIAVVGNVDAGKSTTIGVLTFNATDDGRGLARQNLFKHNHEKETGRTSDLGFAIMGFDAIGNCVNKTLTSLKPKQQRKIVCSKSSKIVAFTDLAGHEKYSKTTAFGLTGKVPDYAMIIISASDGLKGTAKEHLGLALNLNIPIFMVVTKIDSTPAHVLKSTLNDIQKVLKSKVVRKMPFQISTISDVILAAKNFNSQRICPIFKISNVEKTNVDLLEQFLSLLAPRKDVYNSIVGELNSDETEDAEVMIDEKFSVTGIGCVIVGTVLSGKLKKNQEILLGPLKNGSFTSVEVKAIQYNGVETNTGSKGHSIGVALRKHKKADIRRGQVLITKNRLQNYRIPAEISTPVFSSKYFFADIHILNHPSTIKRKYQTIINIGSARQAGSIVDFEDGKSILRTGDRARVKIEFVSQPELIRPGQKFIMRESKTKAVGVVVCGFYQRKEDKKSRGRRNDLENF